jgi:hypothetical protein
MTCDVSWTYDSSATNWPLAAVSRRQAREEG